MLIVTHGLDCLLGEGANGGMVLNDFGTIADECWRAIPEHFPFSELGAHVIIPNHAHGIIEIMDDESIAASPLQRNQLQWKGKEPPKEDLP